MITVYSKTRCVQCDAVKRAFKKAGVDFTELDLTKEPQKLDEFLAAGFASAPVVVADGHETFAGFQPDRVQAIIDGLGDQ